MRKYLATLHKRPDHHKKNFAMGVSGGVTLSIFAVWMVVNFGATPPAVAQQASVHEVGPFESLGQSLGSTWGALKESFGELTESLGGVDVKSGYEDLKDKTLEEYGPVRSN